MVQAYRTGDDPDGDGGVGVRLVPVAEIEERLGPQHRAVPRGAAAEVVDVRRPSRNSPMLKGPAGRRGAAC